MVLYERLINHNFFTYNLLKKQIANSFPKGTYSSITISRETGSGGKKISELLAKKLNLKIYDKKLVTLIAKTAQKRRKIIKSLDEKTQNAISSIINSFFGFKSLPESAYIKSLCKVVLGIVSNHSAIFVGRGANFVLPKESTLRVRIIAPFKTRVMQTRTHEKINLEKAREKIRKIHKQRKDFVTKYFSKNISNANYYDLVINTERLDLKKASQIITKAYRQKFI